MELSGRTYVVAGGAGVAGESLTEALLRRGATVAVPSRSSARLDRLREGLDPALRHRLHGLLGDLGEPAAAERLCHRLIDTVGPPDGVIASLGAWWEGEPLTQVAYKTWQRILHDNLTTHFLAARTFLPVLADRPGGVYIALTGIAALKPVAGSGPVSVTDAAKSMLLRTFAAELQNTVRIHEVAVLTPIITRHWPAGHPVLPGWLTGDQVGSFVADVAAPGFPEAATFQLRFPADWDISG